MTKDTKNKEHVELPYWYESNQKALSENSETYKDPETGATVFTSLFHMRRGKCCGSKCRHCPYNHINVPEQKDTK